MKTGLIALAICVLFGIVADAWVVGDSDPISTHSFRPPYSTGRAGIRGWNYGGDVTVYQDYLRLTQDQQSQIGYIWNKNPLNIRDWEMTLSVKIDGKGRLGGDGIAFWYASKPSTPGKAFGSLEQWKGLGVFIDTFDNDNKHDNPYISVVVNDGSMVYNPDTDSKDIEIGGCRAAFRKTSGNPMLRVTYRGSSSELKVEYDLNGNGNYQECYTGTVDLPTGYHLGVSAATGGVSDNQDVYFLELRRLSTDDSNFNRRNNERNKQQQQQQEKTEKEMDALKQEIDALRKVTSTNTEEKAANLNPEDVVGRISLVEEQLKQIEAKLNAMTNVANGIETISKSIEQLKQRVDSNNKPTSSFDANQFKSELAKQQQELNRIASKAQESIVSVVDNRVNSVEQSTRSLRERVDALALESKKTGGNFMNIVMIIIMVGETCLLLVMFMKGRRVNKYDKMW